MMFQALDGKGNQFLDLLDNNYCFIELSYVKRGPWLQLFGHSNSLCAHASRAITNHAPIREYRLRFFPREEFKCSCSVYPIKSRKHILHDCTRFNGYWNLRRDSLSYFVMFLKANPNAFAFLDNSFTTSVSRPYSQLYLLFFFLSYFSFSFLFLQSISSSSFSFLSLVFFSFLLHVCLLLLYVVMKVATTACHHAPCNKLVILKIKKIQSLPSNYILISMLELRHSDNNSYHCLSLKKLTSKQQLNVKGSIVDANNRLNKVFPFFISFNSGFLPGNRLINIYPSYFSFHSTDKYKESRQVHI